MMQVLQYITTKSCAGNKTEAEGEEEEEGDQENGGKISGRPDMETDTPWVSLASLALFKLFNDWQAQVTLLLHATCYMLHDTCLTVCSYLQGYVMPPGIMRGNPNMGLPEAAVAAAVAAAGAGAGGGAGAVAKPKKPAAPKGDKVLPENPQVLWGPVLCKPHLRIGIVNYRFMSKLDGVWLCIKIWISEIH